MTTNDINKWLRYIIYGGIFLVPFIPWIVASSSYFPFITGKNFIFRVIVEIIFALWAILILRDKKDRPNKSWILYSILALAVIDIFATFFGLNPFRSFWSNYERMDGLINLLHLVAYFVVLISIMKNKLVWFYLANTALLANVYIATYSVMQLAGKAQVHQSATRLDASLGNSAYLAVYVLFMIFISAYLLFLMWPKNKALSVWYIVMITANIIILYYTATRGAILGLIGGVLLTCLLLVILRPGLTRKIAGAVIVFAILSVSGFYSIRNTDFVQKSQVLSRFAEMSLSGGTAGSRMMIWKMSWQGFTERPVLGWGPENYSMVFSKYYDPGMYGQEPWFDRSHNIFFDWLINAGVLGLLAYLSVYLSALYYLWFRRKDERENDFTQSVVASSLLTGLFAGYFFHNIFVFDNLISYILFFSLVAFIHFTRIERKEEKDLFVKKDYHTKKDHDQNQIDLIPTFGAIVVPLVLIACLYGLNYKPWSVSTDLIKAIRPDTAPEKSLVIFQDIFKQNTFGSGEALEQFVNKTMNIVGNEKISNEVKTEYVKLADEQIKIYLTRFDQDARSLIFFGSYLASTGRVDEGLALLEKAQSISPKKQQVLFQLVSTYVQKQDATRAVAMAKSAYELDPTYSEARKIYALILFMTGQTKLGYEIIAPIKNDPDYFNDPRFLNIYEQMGDTKSIQEIKDLQLKEAKK